MHPAVLRFLRRAICGPWFLFLVPALVLAPTAGPAAEPSAPGAGGQRIVLVVGDSLSAEYGIERGSGWVSRLGRRLAERAGQYTVVNASISGDTTSGGVARLPALLREHHPAVVVIELGGNDGLRGLPVRQMRANLEAMAAAARAAGARVLLVGMRIPPNYGAPYAEAFAAAFAQAARAQGTALLPFLLEGIDFGAEGFQPDRIHPLAAQHERMMENAWAKLRPLL